MIHRTALISTVACALTLAGCGGGGENECTREIPVGVVPAAVHQMTWSDGAGRGDGDDPHALFTVPPIARMCGIRLRFTLETRDAKPAVFQVFWAKAGAEFNEAAGSWSTTLESSPQEQTVVVGGCWPPSTRCAERDIERIRIDPATAPVDFELAEMTVLAQ